jgi:hypothetical protein
VLKILASVASDSLRGVLRDAAREAARDTALFTTALILFASAAVFGEIALYLWLRTQTSGYLAALVVAGVALALALAVGLIANADIGRSKRRRTEPQRATGEAGAASDAGDPIARLAADAESLGKMLGRDAKGYQLVLGAFLIGMMLSRDRDR